MLEVLREDYPARIAHARGVVLLDFVGLQPEVHGDPNPQVLEAIDLAARQERFALVARVRDSRPPPPESRTAIMEQLQAIQHKIACVAIALESLRKTLT